MDIDFVITGQRIREARRFRGLTGEVLAEKVGIATDSLRHIEIATSKPSLQTIFKIATELDVSLDYLTGRTPNLTSVLSDDYIKGCGLSETQKHMVQDVLKNIIPVITEYV